jgi:hypothetical protein
MDKYLIPFRVRGTHQTALVLLLSAAGIIEWHLAFCFVDE